MRHLNFLPIPGLFLSSSLALESESLHDFMFVLVPFHSELRKNILVLLGVLLKTVA